MNPISETLRQHYSRKFDLHGASSEGVDWGSNEAKVLLRYDKMLAVLETEPAKPTLLDVGCGYGGLLRYATEQKIELEYTGIDVSENMIEWARANQTAGTFIPGDFIDPPSVIQSTQIIRTDRCRHKAHNRHDRSSAFANRPIR